MCDQTFLINNISYQNHGDTLCIYQRLANNAGHFYLCGRESILLHFLEHERIAPMF